MPDLALPAAPGLPVLPDQISWMGRPHHGAWLRRRASELWEAFAAPSLNPRGGFFELDDAGAPIRDAGGSGTRGLHVTTRTVFCYALAHLVGHPGADRMVDHGIAFLRRGHRDPVNGGYWWRVGDDGPVDATKQAYGHAFTLLAACAGLTVGHPDAQALYDDVSEVLLTRFWEPRHGASAEEFSADWQPLDTYRGQNSNMHLTEATMAAFETTGDRRWLEMAESIADLLIRRMAAQNGWQVPEHFSDTWELNRDYAGSEMFRPAGTTPGHWLEWSRLVVQLWQLGGRRHAWMPDAAAALFAAAVRQGWDHRGGGGFVYTLDWEGRPRVTDKLWWPATEGAGAAVYLAAMTGDAAYEGWYRAIWGWIERAVIAGPGFWRPQLSAALEPRSTLFTGRPDIYHALQACLIPIYPAEGGLLAMMSRAARKP